MRWTSFTWCAVAAADVDLLVEESEGVGKYKKYLISKKRYLCTEGGKGMELSWFQFGERIEYTF